MLLRVYPFNSSNLATDFSPHLVTKSEFEHVIAFMRAHNYDPSRFDAQISAIQDEFGYSLSMEVPLK